MERRDTRIIFIRADVDPALHGLKAQPELMNVRHEDELWHGHAVPADELVETLKLLTEQSIPHRTRDETAITVTDTADVQALDAALVGYTVGRFLDAAGTLTGRATFYNTLEEQQAAETRLHDAAFAVNRGLYTAMLCLPGVTDHTKQLGLIRLLGRPDAGRDESLLDSEGENDAILRVVKGLSVPRMLKLFGMLRDEKVNNARTRKLILRSILSGRQLELWSTRYRRKLRHALEHALGKRTTGIVKSILSKAPDERDDKERKLLKDHLGRYASWDHEQAYESVGFILGIEDHLTLPLLRAYRDAKRNFKRGQALPYETLEGIRSTYHPERDHSEVLYMTRDKLTDAQRIAKQASAERAGVKVDFDPHRHDAVKLYVYALERGLDEKIREALLEKARKAASGLPLAFEHVGVLLDASGSMAGHRTQKNRPIAVALAMRDMFRAGADRCTEVVCSGQVDDLLIRPEGDSNLAEGLVQLLMEEPEAVFVISDGYENAPAGRMAEVMEAVRRIGIETPVYQLSPVLGAEAGGVRQLAPGRINAMPAADPNGLGLSLLRGTLRDDPARAIKGLMKYALYEPSNRGALNDGTDKDPD